MKTRSFADLAAEEDDELDSIMGDGLLVPGGRFVMYGAAGDFKSFAMAQLLYCLSRGEDWLGFTVHAKMPTLYVELEVPPRLAKRRLRGLEKAYGGPAPTAHLSLEYDWALENLQAAQELRDAILEVGAGAVVLDPLYLVMVGSENNDEAVKKMLRLFNGVLGETRCLGGVVHHENKGLWHEGQKVDRGMADLGGSRFLNAWPDTIMRLSRVGPYNTVELKWEKVRHGEKPEPRWLHLNSSKLVLELSESDPRAVVLQVLTDGPAPIKMVTDKLKETCDMGSDKARKLRQEMVSSGEVEEVGDPENPKRKLLRLRR